MKNLAEIHQPTKTTQNLSNPSNENSDFVASYREQVFRVAFWSAIGFGGVAFWALFIFFGQETNPLILAGMILVYSVLLVLSALSKIPKTYRTAFLIFLLYYQGAISLVSIHHLAAASLFLFSCLTLTGLLAGRKAIYFMGFVALLTVFSASLLLNLPLGSELQILPPELSPLLIGLIYALIVASGIVPLVQYQGLHQPILEINQQLLRKQEEEDKTAISSDTHPQPAREHLSRIRKMTDLLARISPSHPWNDILLQTLSWINQEFGYPHIEIFLESSAGTYQHASICVKSENDTEKISETIKTEDIPDEIQKLKTGISTPDKLGVETTEVLLPSSGGYITNQSSVLIPLKTDQELAGALLIHQVSENDIAQSDFIELELLADFLALISVNKRLVGDELLFPENSHWVNHAINCLNQSETTEEIYSIVDETLKRSSFVTMLFRIEKNTMHLYALNDQDRPEQVSTPQLTINIESGEGIVPNTPLLMRQLLKQSHLPMELLKFLHQLNLVSAAFLPLQPNNQIQRLIILGSQESEAITPSTIQPYVYLTGYATTAIEKIITRLHLHRRVIALQSLASISQAISVVTDLDELFDTIHEQVLQVVGEVDLAIALYDPVTDMISIPYAHEAGQKLTLEPFPLGQGLTSILIRTQRPLMLVKDTERRARELGAKISGAAAKSWLGVPLIVSGEVLGAIILQDTQNEQRFNEDDLHLITTLASQVAITVRNVRLLQETNRRAERERIVSNITSKIWSSPDIESIARNALLELGKALQVSDGTILLQKTSADDLVDTPDSGMKALR